MVFNSFEMKALSGETEKYRQKINNKRPYSVSYLMKDNKKAHGQENIFSSIKTSIMYTNEKTTEVVRDLIRINNDRIEGYEKAAENLDAEDGDLQATFRQMAAESRSYITDLNKYMMNPEMEAKRETTFGGRIYRAWMDVKATFSGDDRKAMLESCEYGEDAAQKAYDSALSSDAELPADLRQLIMDQKASLRRSHDQIRRMRDAQPVRR